VRKPSVWTQTTRKVLIGIALALLVIGFAGAARVQHFVQHLKSARIGLAQLDSVLDGGLGIVGRMLHDPDQTVALHTTVLTLQDDLAAMQDLARPFLAISRHMGWAPWVGGDLKAVPDLLELARQTCEAILSLLDGLTPTLERLTQEGPGLRTLGPELTACLLNSQTQLHSAHASFEQASWTRLEVDETSLSPRLGEMIARFDSYAPSIALTLDALELLPGLLGAQGPKSYLVVAQNSDELRATGGFISGVGRVLVDRGQVLDVSFQDSYTVDNLSKPHPVAPDPLRQYMNAGMLLLRDANWWPDFPSSARLVIELYTQDTGHSIDGVIAVDMTALELLIAVLGPLEVPGYPELVSTSNLDAMLTQYWQAPILVAPGESTDWWSHRKDLAADLLVALLQKAMNQLSSDELVTLTKSMVTALTQRHLQVYVDDPATEAILHRVRWDGAVRAAVGDYLMIVDSNVGFNKVNPNIEQTIDYDVVLDSNGLAASQLTLTYRHTVARPTPACIHEPRYGDSYLDLMERCYWDYLRVYLPAGSELVSLVGSDSPPSVYGEAGCTVIGTAFVLETGQSRTIKLTYRHPSKAEQGRYALLVQKQAGTPAPPLRVRIELPPRSGSSAAKPNSIVTVDGRAVWQGTLAQDLEIEVEWKE